MKKVKVMIIIICIIIVVLFGLIFYTKTKDTKENTKIGDTPNLNTVENAISKEIQTIDKEEISEKNFYTVMYVIEKYSGDENLTFVPLNIRINSGINVDKYLVDGYFTNKDYKVIERMYLYVNLDNSNKTYSIEKLDKDKIDFTNIEIENSDQNIENNLNNSFSELSIDDSYMVKQCFKYIKLNLIIYNKFIYENLDEEYKKAKFNDIKTYEQYITNNLEKFKKMEILKYVKEDYDGKVRYTFINNYYDSYVVTNEENYVKYSIMLDNYTIITDDMLNKYNKSSNKNKVYTNIENFINMINNKDYESAYKVLDNEYKEDKFPTLDLFEKYVKENFYDYNVINTTNDIVRGDDGIYIWTFTIKSSVALSAYEKEMTFMINLGDNMDYTIGIKE